MRKTTPYQQMIDTSLAVRLIQLGARLIVLSNELNVSKEKLLALYKEVSGGDSSPKGMLPSSVDWFVTWQPCAHSSLFMAYYKFFESTTTLSKVELLIKSYEMYLEEVSRHRNYDEEQPVLSITRAWMMLRMINVNHPLLVLTRCKNCIGNFVTRSNEGDKFYENYVCGFCNKPIRAGKTEKYSFV